MEVWDEILSFFNQKQVRSVLLCCHRNTDPDALGSAYGLKVLIRESCPEIERVEIVVDGVNRASKRLIGAYPEIQFEQEIAYDPSAFILVDVSNVWHLGTLAESVFKSSKPILVVDHHTSQVSSPLKPQISFVDEQASSTCEIVCSFYESIGKTPSKTVATILLIGIVYDSKRFSFIGKSAFRAAAFLIDSGADYQMAISILRQPLDRSERIARLKAAQRSKIVNTSGWVIGLSEVGSFGASGCRGLIDLGADLAIVSSDRKKLRRVSARSTSKFYKDTGVDLAKVMEKVGIELGASGGGHPTAATVSGMDDVKVAEKLVLKHIQERIKETKLTIEKRTT
jgi:nanoRNase/pAp phosphatase (c-di-AMP/oligoRNAs hydrolase)